MTALLEVRDLFAEPWTAATLGAFLDPLPPADGFNRSAVKVKSGEGVPELLACIDKKLDKGTRRVTLHLPYDKAGLLDGLYREAKVESVDYAATIDVVAVCPPKVLGQVKEYIENWQEPKEDWEL